MLTAEPEAGLPAAAAAERADVRADLLAAWCSVRHVARRPRDHVPARSGQDQSVGMKYRAAGRCSPVGRVARGRGHHPPVAVDDAERSRDEGSAKGHS